MTNTFEIAKRNLDDIITIKTALTGVVYEQDIPVALEACNRLFAYQTEYIAWIIKEQAKFERWKQNPDGPNVA
jgi:hypothetical protein